MSQFGGAVVLGTGELRFRPQSFSFCGHCDKYFMMCTCKNIPAARDYNFKSLPAPAASSTASMLLRRWCSCVNMSMSMGCFAALEWYADHSEIKLEALAARRTELSEMVDEYVAKLPTDPALPLLCKAMNLSPRAASQAAARIGVEARSAAAAFVAGDWNCVTRIGALLLNNAFQSSDAERFPLSDQQLADVFSAVDVLNKVLGMGFSDMGWCLAIENDRAPLVTPSLPGASERFKAAAFPDTDDAEPFTAANGACRCGSLTHKRTNHSSCPLNPKKSRAAPSTIFVLVLGRGSVVAEGEFCGRRRGGGVLFFSASIVTLVR